MVERFANSEVSVTHLMAIASITDEYRRLGFNTHQARCSTLTKHSAHCGMAVSAAQAWTWVMRAGICGRLWVGRGCARPPLVAVGRAAGVVPQPCRRCTGFCAATSRRHFAPPQRRHPVRC
eukprot:683232-Prymnesium_polylepis.1